MKTHINTAMIDDLKVVARFLPRSECGGGGDE